MTIGGRYEKNRVYYLVVPPITNHVLFTIVSSEQWHYRLGHPSTRMLHQLGLPVHSSSIFECESYQLDKRHQSFFSIYGQ